MTARWTFVSGLALLVLIGCGETEPIRYRLNENTRKLPGEIQNQIAGALQQYFGTLDAPYVLVTGDLEEYRDYFQNEKPSESPFGVERLEEGAKLFRRHCMHCHGAEGNGEGPTARFLNPRPRDYQAGKFKFASTPRNVKPTRDDLIRIVSNGVEGTSMPSFKLYGEETIEELVSYVTVLSMRGELERMMGLDYYAPAYNPATDKDQLTPAYIRENYDNELTAQEIQDLATGIYGGWAGASEEVIQVEGEPPPANDAESIAAGRELFMSESAQCVSCHGKDGKGRGVKEQTDEWGNVTHPADLTRGMYRGGGRPQDLWRRIYAGIEGTPMPAFGNQLQPEQIWNLVNFVRSLTYTTEPKAPN